MNLSPAKKRFVDLASATYGDGAVMTRDEVKTFVKENGKKLNQATNMLSGATYTYSKQQTVPYINPLHFSPN